MRYTAILIIALVLVVPVRADNCNSNVFLDFIRGLSASFDTSNTVCKVNQVIQTALPNLNVPTPFQTPTAETIGMYVPESDLLNDLSTLQANVNYIPTQIAVQGNQVYYQGRPMLPNNSNNGLIFGYIKWTTTSASYSLTGPLSPIVIHLGIFIVLSLAFLIFYYVRLIIVSLWRFIWWLIDIILRLIPFIG